MEDKLSCLLFCSTIFVIFPSISRGETQCSTPGTNPNIIFFYADDLGFGDVSCFGNTKVNTPNIDKLAKEGMKLTRMYSQPICTPSRAALMTGRFPARNGMIQGLFDLPVLSSPAQPSGLLDPEKEPNLASTLKQANYHTQIIGKWHLGFGDNGTQGPTSKGFDGFYGAPMTHSEPCSSYTKMDDIVVFNQLIVRFQFQLGILGFVILILRLTLIGNKGLIIFFILIALSVLLTKLYLFLSLANPSACLFVRNTTVVEQPYEDENLTLRMTGEAIKYLKSLKAQTEHHPFFLMVSYLTPHVPPIVSKYHRGKSGHGMYYDSLLELDWSIGKIMATLKSLGLDKNTLVIFSSDNGPTPHNGFTNEYLEEQFRGTAGSIKDPDGVSVPLRGWKGSNYEGGIRVPGIVRWPGKIGEGSISNAITSQMDILPTLLEIVQVPVGPNYKIDGKSLLNLFKSPTDNPVHHKILFHFCDINSIGAVSYYDYKLHYFEGSDNYSCRGVKYDQPYLYNLVDDPGETSPLDIENYMYKDVVTAIELAVQQLQASLNPSFSQLMYPAIPWHFPCENFPSCTKSLKESDEFNFEELGIPI